jgi:DNA-binding NarL/FixJ family response regulator
VVDERSPKIRVLVADDHPVFRRGLREVIEEEPDLDVVAEAEDGTMALDRLLALRPRIAVLDIGMPRKDGLVLAAEVRELRLDVGIIFLTMHKEEAAFNRALDLGAKGYVLKDSAAADIVASIRAVAAGRNYISPEISTYLFNRMSRVSSLAQDRPVLQSLTPMERQIVRLIAHKKTSKEIADELCISPRTVDNHRNNICRKLDLHGINALLKFALEHRSDLA